MTTTQTPAHAGTASLDAETAAILALLNSGFPRVETLPAAEVRAIVASRQQPVPNVDDADSRDTVVPATDPARDIPVRIYIPRGPDVDSGGPVVTRPGMVFFHGGGFVFCGLDSHDGFCREMAKNLDSVVVAVDYRLAPEHRAPAAAHDAVAAYDWVLAHAEELGVDAARIVVAGDSAGGNLAAVVAVAAAQTGRPTPVAQVLIYPAIDPACDTESYRTYGEGWFNTAAAMHWYWEQYLGEGAGVGEHDWWVAPNRAPDHAGLPAAVVVSAGCDPLVDETSAYVSLLARSGVPVVHRIYPGLFHGFLTYAGFGPARSARARLWRDLSTALTPRPTPEATS